MKRLLLLPFFFISLTSFAQTKLTIQSLNEKCAEVASYSPDTALGDGGFEAFVNRFGANKLIRRSFLELDLSSIPQGSKVNWARLTLYGIYIGGYNSSKLRRITSAWDPNTVTWNTQPSTTKRGQVSLANSTSQTEDYKNINVTNLIQAMVDSPATGFGFALKLDSEHLDPGGTFRDMGFSSPGLSQGGPHFCPKLIVEYTAPGLQKPEVTLLSVDLSGSSAEMNIYPNPCNEAFNCNIKSTETDAVTLRVIDMLGRTVFSQPVNTSSLQMRVNLPSSSVGTYFVILQDNKGATIVSQQLQVK